MVRKVCLTSVFFISLLAPPFFSWAGIIDSKAPDFTLQDISGRTVSLKDFRGKVVFIDFWASWCPPCRKELPEINRISGKYRNDAVFIAINVDRVRSHAYDFLRQMPGLSDEMRILFDADSKVIASFNAAAMPTSFVVDRGGTVRYVHFGFRESDPDSWAEEIGGLLK